MGGCGNKRRHLWALLALLVPALVGAGCGLPDRSTAPVAPVALRLALSFGEAGPATSVDSVDLVIRYVDRDSVVQALRLNQGAVWDTLYIDPGDSVVFVLRAFGADGRLLYLGSKGPINVVSGAPIVLEIYLEPVVLMLRPGPAYQESRLGTDELIRLYVDVHNVDSLFGASFRLTWYPRILALQAAAEGDFLDDPQSDIPTLFFVEINNDNDTGFAACAVTRGGSPNVFTPGKTGSGCLATFEFAKVDTGVCQIQFEAEPGIYPRLTKPDGNPVSGFTGLFLESATVRVTGNSSRQE